MTTFQGRGHAASRTSSVTRPTHHSGSGSQLRLLQVIVQAGPTNSQWNEHCLPVADERRITVCSLLPATVDQDPRIPRLEGDGSVTGAFRVLRRALAQGPYDAIHVHSPSSAVLLLAACALRPGTAHRVVFTLHNSWPNLRPRNRALAIVAIASFPTVVACSRSSASSIPRWVRRLARRPVEVVPNGVDVSRIDRVVAAALGRSTPEGTHRSGLRVLTIGRLIAIKDHSTLLRAFSRFAGADDRLVVVGEGPLRNLLQAQIAELGIGDRVDMPGLVERDEVYRLLAEADCFVSASHGEGLPLSVLEAMSAGLPVVLSDIPPHRELVERVDGATLVRIGDVDGFASALSQLRLLSPESRRAVGARHRRFVERRFSVREMTAGYDQVFLRVAGTNNHHNNHHNNHQRREIQ